MQLLLLMLHHHAFYYSGCNGTRLFKRCSITAKGRFTCCKEAIFSPRQTFRRRSSSSSSSSITGQIEIPPSVSSAHCHRVTCRVVVCSARIIFNSSSSITISITG